MKREDITLDQVRLAFAYMDYAFFSAGDYNLNIFGIRNNDLQTDTFNCILPFSRYTKHM